MARDPGSPATRALYASAAPADADRPAGGGDRQPPCGSVGPQGAAAGLVPNQERPAARDPPAIPCERTACRGQAVTGWMALPVCARLRTSRDAPDPLLLPLAAA